ncbi:MAG: pilus assembly protein, partial [Candidatus Eiseniibacteriota bacterium]
MRQPLRLFAFVLGAMAGLGFARMASASCDVPLAIGGAAAQANVLIILDNSGSMNEALVSADYNPLTTYKNGKFKKGNTYNIKTSQYYTPHMIDTSLVAVTPSAYLVTSDGGQSAQYDGNYLNWLYYYATAAQIAAIPVVTRIQSAKSVVSSVLGSVTGVRFALEDYGTSKNGKMLCNFGTAIATMQTTVAGIVASTSTPLAGALNSAMVYYQTSNGANAAIQASCQKNFVIIVTDGLPTSDMTSCAYATDVDKDGSLLDDVASYMYKSDMRADLTGLQNVATFTIGYNVDANLLAKTATKGGGAYFSISDGAGLVNALNADFNIIAARVAAGTAVSVVSSDDRTNNKLYRARYQSQTWRGFVEAFQLPYTGGNTPIWEAGAQLAAMNPDTRNLLTSTTGTDTYAFTAANSATLMTLLGVAQDTTAKNLINYVRGKSFAWYRDRSGWILGDIIDAAPVSVGHPNAFNNFLDYWSFRTSHVSRAEMVYVAANDGQLHCFNASTGAEQWAYVPKVTLPQLSALADPAYCHQYYLNVTPAAYDIYMGGVWKTVIIGGQAQAGNGYFALDVTSPAKDSVRVLWDATIANMQG